MYDIVLSQTARGQIKKLPLRYKKSAIEALEDLRHTPLAGKALVRELAGRFSFQFGPYRIIYKINKQAKRVEVLAVRHRQYAYS
jgi:mRNA-degrading endonuclease RelE of RelBE toxin-antitoxin system